MAHNLILQLDMAGNPKKWIDYEKAAYYYCKDLVAWEAGVNEITLYGGVNRIVGERSKLSMNSIISIKGNVKTHAVRSPTLNNRIMFRRDGHMCAYCGHKYGSSALTRDHIHPKRHGGKDVWNNVITSCKPCNNYKGDKLLNTIGMKLLYQPYTPTRAEHIFFANPSLLDDQYDFLVNLIHKDSRIPVLYPRIQTT